MKTYTISELAREFGVTARALRFYEDKDLLHPSRDGLNRVYSARDRARLKLILQGKSVGFSLIEIKELLDLYTLAGHHAQIWAALQKGREQIQNLTRQRADIDFVLETLRKSCEWAEQKLNAQEDAPPFEAERSLASTRAVRHSGPHASFAN